MEGQILHQLIRRGGGFRRVCRIKDARFLQSIAMWAPVWAGYVQKLRLLPSNPSISSNDPEIRRWFSTKLAKTVDAFSKSGKKLTSWGWDPFISLFTEGFTHFRWLNSKEVREIIPLVANVNPASPASKPREAHVAWMVQFHKQLPVGR